MNKTITGIATSFALAASMTAANAGPVPTIVDNTLHQRIFQIKEDWNVPGRSAITRGMMDEAANVYCEWQVSADIDKKYNISNLTSSGHACHVAKPSDAAQWAGGKTTNAAAAFGSVHYFSTVDKIHNTVIDGVKTGPNGANIVSEFGREWNFKAGEVCLHSEEGKAGKAPYMQDDMGCFPIPQNKYVDEIKAKLAP